MDHKGHRLESVQKLGHHFSHVHQWLDAFAGTKKFGMRHRKKRHHLNGIEEVREIWGDEAAEAARLHIISDLKMEGWTEEDHFPVNEEDYAKMELF